MFIYDLFIVQLSHLDSRQIMQSVLIQTKNGTFNEQCNKKLDFEKHPEV